MIALALVLVTAAAASATSVACGTTPILRVSRPLVVQGRHFRAGETVVVSFTGRDFRRTRRARTTATGSFETRIPPHPKCLGRLLVVARGARGDTARLSLAGEKCGPLAPPVS